MAKVLPGRCTDDLEVSKRISSLSDSELQLSEFDSYKGPFHDSKESIVVAYRSEQVLPLYIVDYKLSC